MFDGASVGPSEDLQTFPAHLPMPSVPSNKAQYLLQFKIVDSVAQREGLIYKPFLGQHDGWLHPWSRQITLASICVLRPTRDDVTAPKVTSCL